MTPIRIVLDTNVIVSAAINETGFEAAILALGLAGKIRIYISEPVLKEYEGVLVRPKFRFPPSMVEALIKEICSTAKMVSPKRRVAESIDPKDDIFLECAEEAKADYLVTGNKKHFPKRWVATDIVNARELFAIIAPNLKP
ncbi:MAG: putative toxin-antitoxin system toxin component, PIN family [Acidobacteria bacterium]|nr:putative toxin-antitoxin system toxin component, PIN family [Acidobacteriota bacterium]